MLGTILGKVECRILKDADQLGQLLDHVLALAELVGVVEVRKVAARKLFIGRNQRGDNLGVDLVADISAALEGDHVLEAAACGNDDRRREVIAIAVFVADVFDEQQKQHVVFVLTGVHTTPQLVAGCPEGGVEVGFLDRHQVLVRIMVPYRQSTRAYPTVE